MIETIEELLTSWAQEYGGGNNPGLDFPSRSPLQTVIDHHGFSPSSAGFIPIPIRTKADEIEIIVREMATGEYRKQAHILCCDYFNPGFAIDQRIDILRRAGIQVSRAGYYEGLSIAKAYVWGAYKARNSDSRMVPVCADSAG